MAKKKKKAARKRKDSKTKYAQVTIERLLLSDIADAPFNHRLISQEALSGLTQSLIDFGLLTHPVVNKVKGRYMLLGGHKRRTVLQDDGVTEVDCIVVEFDEAKAQHANVTLNNEAIQGEFVPQLLKDVLARIKEGVGEGHKELFSRLRFDVLYRTVLRQLAKKTDPKKNGKVSKGKTRDDDIPTLSRTKAVSKEGVVYALGEHRILCGKITSPGSLEAFNIDQCEMGFTRLSQTDLFTDEFLLANIGHLLQNVDGAVYLSSDLDSLASVQSAFLGLGGHWSNTLMHFQPEAKGRRDDPYRDVVVPVLYGWREGANHVFYGGRKQSNTIHTEGAPPKTDVAVEVVQTAMQNSSKQGDAILDVWMAHGATLIAAEKLGRRLFGYVGSPRELDRIRHRWTSFVHGPKADWRKKTGEAA